MRKRYTEKEKDKALKLLAREAPKHKSINALLNTVAEKVGCSPLSLMNWMKKRGLKLRRENGRVVVVQQEQFAVETRIEEQSETTSTANMVTDADFKAAHENATQEYLRSMIRLNEQLERDRAALIRVLRMLVCQIPLMRPPSGGLEKQA